MADKELIEQLKKINKRLGWIIALIIIAGLSISWAIQDLSYLF
jgi:hypothetical protein